MGWEVSGYSELDWFKRKLFSLIRKYFIEVEQMKPEENENKEVIVDKFSYKKFYIEYFFFSLSSIQKV